MKSVMLKAYDLTAGSSKTEDMLLDRLYKTRPTFPVLAKAAASKFTSEALATASAKIGMKIPKNITPVVYFLNNIKHYDLCQDDIFHELSAEVILSAINPIKYLMHFRDQDLWKFTANVYSSRLVWLAVIVEDLQAQYPAITTSSASYDKLCMSCVWETSEQLAKQYLVDLPRNDHYNKVSAILIQRAADKKRNVEYTRLKQ